MSRSEKLFANNSFIDHTELVDIHTGIPMDFLVVNKSDNRGISIGVVFKEDEVEWLSTYLPKEEKVTFFITDIHPDDNTALLIANDTTVLECYIRNWAEEDIGRTRLALYDFHKPLLTACYSDNGKWIAALSEDSSYYLYDALYGTYYEEGADTARYIISQNDRRKLEIFMRDTDVLLLRDGTKFDDRYLYRNRTFDYDEEYVLSHLHILSEQDKQYWEQYIADSIIWTYFIDSKVLDSLLVSDSIENNEQRWKDRRVFIGNHMEIGYEKHPEYFSPAFAFFKDYYKTFAISPDNKRVFITNGNHYIEGKYLETGSTFYYKEIPVSIHSLYFTEDNQYLVINANEDTQMILPMKPLPELLEECKGFFFNWKMSDTDRFKAYKQLTGTSYYHEQ